MAYTVSQQFLKLKFVIDEPNRGRKRHQKDVGLNIYELIHLHVIPRWQKYLSLKIQKVAKIWSKPRKDTIWKKVLRDVREFFRILFRKRFHYLDYKSSKTSRMCTKKLFNELGFQVSEKDIQNVKLFRFLHQSHKTNPKIALNGYQYYSAYDIIERYNEDTRKLFMTNLLWAKMFYFVFTNFMEEYWKFVKMDYRDDVITMICLLLNCYKKMKHAGHLERITFLFHL